jgi:hypothetical protein
MPDRLLEPGMNKSHRVIKKYPNRRLYDTANSGYITLVDVKQISRSSALRRGRSRPARSSGRCRWSGFSAPIRRQRAPMRWRPSAKA